MTAAIFVARGDGRGYLEGHSVGASSLPLHLRFQFALPRAGLPGVRHGGHGGFSALLDVPLDPSHRAVTVTSGPPLGVRRQFGIELRYVCHPRGWSGTSEPSLGSPKTRPIEAVDVHARIGGYDGRLAVPDRRRPGVR